MVFLVHERTSTSFVDFRELIRGVFHVNSASAAEAVAAGRPFNAIHLKRGYKVDFFPAALRRKSRAGGTAFPHCQDWLTSTFPWPAPKIQYLPNWFGFATVAVFRTGSGTTFSACLVTAQD